ncbi:hypothetical protein M0R88_04765 [Halorussus gelatinilyticus]|uniref:DUF7511 domain-containing protein n=1 Tax=Halorussus gelatinilyticus TaxID=2937524 RepID=A0A8U0IL64_9EURY|nr:hypothetical protein [Halorussus gelatinilyticus]UPW01416.1 hypothetical protein M0R88_04765 [Halorussus gelatinilyticus]
MTDVTSPNADDCAPTDDPPSDRPADLRAVVEERDDRPDECTLYPPDADDEALVAEWITAEEGSFVDLDEMR